MTAQTILPANTLSSGGYDVDNSLRFNKGSSDHLSITPSSAGSLQKYTFSAWVKRSNLGANSTIFGARVDANTNFFITFRDEDDISIKNKIGGTTTTLLTNRLFRDPSAWYHVVVAMDTTQGTASNRTKIYINGVQETSFATEQYPAEDANTAVNQTVEHNVGDDVSDSGFFNGYMAEVVFINNAQLAPTSFGEFDSDSGIWKPIDGLADLTFGTNGFYLEFKQSGTSQNSSGLGADTSGEDNHFAVNNLTAVDQSTDTCTNNFATWNSLINSNGAITEGNLKYTTSNSSSNYGYRLSTIGVNKGKWYAEIKYTSSSVQGLVGIRSREATAVVHYLGYYADDYGFYIDGSIFQDNTDRGDLGASWGNDDIVGIYLDLDNNKLYFSKNGTLYTATGYDITAAASTTTGNYFFSATEWNSSGNGAFELNAGNPVSALANAAITDDNGYGAFEYSPNITGDSEAKKFYALNTKNLAEFG